MKLDLIEDNLLKLLGVLGPFIGDLDEGGYETEHGGIILPVGKKIS